MESKKTLQFNDNFEIFILCFPDFPSLTRSNRTPHKFSLISHFKVCHRKNWGRAREIVGLLRGRPSANAANSYLEFPACKSQKFGHWANIRPLLEKAKKFTICIGNSAPLRTFFLKNLENFDYRFFRKQKLFSGPFWVTWLKISRVVSLLHSSFLSKEAASATRR